MKTDERRRTEAGEPGTDDRGQKTEDGPSLPPDPRPPNPVPPTTGLPLGALPGREKARADRLEARRLEACQKSCQNCVFALRPVTKWFRILLAELPGLLACFNHANAPGEMAETFPHHVCRNFHYRHQPSFRLEAPAPPGPGIRVIPLTRGKCAYVDAEDYDRIAQHKWTAYYTCGKWYAGRTDHGKCILMHREIMKAPKGKVVDHIDGNGLNNCKSNLRVCTYSQNNVHHRPSGASSQYKCVYRDEKRNRWRSTPAYRGRSVYNGRYEKEEDAARASDYMNVQLNGEFAYLNFPAEWPKGRIQEVYKAGQAERDRLEAIGDRRQVTSDRKDEGGRPSVAESNTRAKVKRKKAKG